MCFIIDESFLDNHDDSFLKNLENDNALIADEDEFHPIVVLSNDNIENEVENNKNDENQQNNNYISMPIFFQINES